MGIAILFCGGNFYVFWGLGHNSGHPQQFAGLLGLDCVVTNLPDSNMKVVSPAGGAAVDIMMQYFGILHDYFTLSKARPRFQELSPKSVNYFYDDMTDAVFFIKLFQRGHNSP